MLIEEIDDIGLQPLKRRLGDRLDVVGAAVDAAAAGSRLQIDVEAELGRDCDLVAHGRERLADEFLVDERAIGFGGVEQGHASLDRRPD